MTGVMIGLVREQGFDLALAWSPALQHAIGDARTQTVHQAPCVAAEVARPEAGPDVVAVFVESAVREAIVARRERRAATRQAKYRSNGFAAVEAPAALGPYFCQVQM